MSFDTEIILMARSIYVQKRTIDKTFFALKEAIKEKNRLEGKNIKAPSKNTIKYWRDDYKWDDYLGKIDQKAREYDEIKRDLKQNLLITLHTRRETLEKQMEAKPNDTQLGHIYNGTIDRILKLEGMDTDTNTKDYSQVYDEVVEAMQMDGIAGKVLATRKEHILKRLKRKHKND